VIQVVGARGGGDLGDGAQFDFYFVVTINKKIKIFASKKNLVPQNVQPNRIKNSIVTLILQVNTTLIQTAKMVFH
jgi:hypothetical protein